MTSAIGLVVAAVGATALWAAITNRSLTEELSAAVGTDVEALRAIWNPTR